MTLGSSLRGGIPRCQGAGGRAGHVQFGARTGGSSIILGSVLLGAGLFLSASIGTVFKVFPHSVLGVILFLAGVQLGLGRRVDSGQRAPKLLLLGRGDYLKVSEKIGCALARPSSRAFQIGERVVRIPERQTKRLQRP